MTLSLKEVVLITDKIYPFYLGGYERRNWELAVRLSNTVNVKVLTSLDHRSITAGDNLTLYRVFPRLSYLNSRGYRNIVHNLAYSLGLLRFIGIRASIIDANATPYIHLPLVYLIARLRRIPLVITCHEALYDSIPDLVDRLFLRWPQVFRRLFVVIARGIYLQSLIHADKLVAVSAPVARVLEQELRRPVTVIPLGVSRTGRRSSQKQVSTRGAFEIGYVGRLHPEKRVCDLITAVAKLNSESKGCINAHIIGGGPIRQDLESECVRLGAKSAVEFHGVISEQERDKILSGLDAFAMPSAREGFSLASLEALSFGIPVIAALPTRGVDGIASIVTDGVNGLLYPVGDVSKLCMCIRKLMTNRSLRLQLSESAERASKEYQWDRIGERLIDTYEGLLELKAS